MKQKYPDFEDFLHEYYSEKVNPTCLDDMLPDATADWIGELDSDDFIRLANKYGIRIAEISLHNVADNLGVKI